MASTNSFGYQGAPSGGANGGQPHGQAANNGFVSGILTSSAAAPPPVTVTPFGATGTITQQLLPPGVVDDAAAGSNQLAFPATNGPPDYQWVDQPISQPLKQRINHYGRAQQLPAARQPNAQQQPPPPLPSHPANLPHPLSHLQAPQHQHAPQATHSHTQPHPHFAHQSYATHPSHQSYVTSPFSSHMPLTSPFEDGSSVQVSVNVQVQGQGTQPHSQPASRFDLMGPASLPARPSAPLPPQAHTAEAPQPQAMRYSRMGNAALAPELLRVDNVGATMGMPTGRAPPMPVQAPTKPARVRQPRSRRKSQPPGTPCVPVHLRNPKKGRDRVFRKCQFCNHDNHIRRSKCDSCDRPLPAGKRRRDGSMHFEKLKREKLAATPLSAASSAAPAAQTSPIQGKAASAVNDVVVDVPSSNSSMKPGEPTSASKVAASNPLPAGVLPLPAAAAMPNANNVHVAGVLPLPAPPANPNNVNAAAAVHPHPSALLHGPEQSHPPESLPQAVPVMLADNAAHRHQQPPAQGADHLEPSALHPQTLAQPPLELPAPVVVRLDPPGGDVPHAQRLDVAIAQPGVPQALATRPAPDMAPRAPPTHLAPQEQVAVQSRVAPPPPPPASQRDNTLDVAQLRASTHLDATNNRPD